MGPECQCTELALRTGGALAIGAAEQNTAIQHVILSIPSTPVFIVAVLCGYDPAPPLLALSRALLHVSPTLSLLSLFLLVHCPNPHLSPSLGLLFTRLHFPSPPTRHSGSPVLGRACQQGGGGLEEGILKARSSTRWWDDLLLSCRLLRRPGCRGHVSREFEARSLPLLPSQRGFLSPARHKFENTPISYCFFRKRLEASVGDLAFALGAQVT